MGLFAAISNSRKVPGFIPGDVAARLAGKSFTIRLPKNVRKRMQTPQKIDVAEHAAKYRMVTDGPHQGPWRNELAPQSEKIMQTYSKPYVRELWYCGVEQGSKTNTMLNCMHWAVDIDPGDIFYLMPTEDTSKKIVDGKIIPMVRGSKRLKKYVPRRQDDMGLKQIKLSNGVTIRPAWANSPASQASFPAKHIFGDEVDKNPVQSGREARPDVLIRKRLRMYRGRGKCFLSSTPAQGIIYPGVMGCAQVFQYRNKCPHCGGYVKFTGECLVIPEGLEPGDVCVETKLFVVCPDCGAQLSNIEFELSRKSAAWVCIKGADVVRPSTVGFHFPCWPCQDISLSEIATYWLTKERLQDMASAIAWANGYEAIDYEHEQKDRDEDFILRLVDEHQPREVVPDEAYGLVVMADTQRIGFFYQVWAVGYGMRFISTVDHGFVQCFADLTDIQQKDYESASGRKYRPMAGFIDSGGGTNPEKPKHSRTVEVYEFCRTNKFWRPLKGRKTMDMPWNVKRLDYYPSSVGKKVPIPGGLNLYTINTTFFKDELDFRLQLDPGSRGALSFHSGVGDDVAKQLTAEYRDERGYWQCPKGKDNHHWDVMVYGLALCEIMGIKNKKKKVEKQAKKQSRGGGFVNNY